MFSHTNAAAYLRIFAICGVLWWTRCEAAPSLVVSQDILDAVYAAARVHHVDAQQLIRIALVESRLNPKAKRINTNGTIDWGLFQINSVHWTTTCASYDITTLRGNALCAAKILAKIKKRHGNRDPSWVGRYHSATPRLKEAYRRKLQRIERDLRGRLEKVTRELEQCRQPAFIEEEEPVFAAAKSHNKTVLKVTYPPQVSR